MSPGALYNEHGAACTEGGAQISDRCDVVFVPVPPKADAGHLWPRGSSPSDLRSRVKAAAIGRRSI